MASIENLASSITEEVSKLSSLLKEAGVPPPTLDEAGFRDFGREEDTPAGNSLREARSKILDAAQDLIRLVKGPIEQVLTLTWAAADTKNLDLITRLKIPQHVPLESSISIQKLAATVQVPEPLLARALRYAIGNGIFVEETPNVIKHSAASAALASDSHLADITIFGTEFLSNVLMKIPDAVLLKRDDPEHAVDTAFNIAYRTDESIFEYLHKHEELSKKYHVYLEGRVNTPLWSVDRLREAWPWASKGKVTVVDVGGSVGHTVQALAPLMPDATFIVQDNNLPALDMGRQAIASDPSLRSRISFAEYNFFKPQTIEADIYIYRHILHDWDDENAVKILSSLLPALKPRARVLISEGIIPNPPAKRLNTLTDKMVRIEDMFMLGVHDAKERTVADFETLFQKASPSAFRLVGVTSGAQAGAFNSLLEFEFLGLAN
ncbi:putative O-methyltransferase [Hypoxylon trugodes]|uniref:putative O-methyltransferase n=1 Tax=Hypoxylon trugodes TaxID=326681 RepID=UPI00219652F7|nr:putative O-methyltransferase [Hypoxylon trugodes]KAI1387802.1 putative O-methyltransferase [Hypoxylon trugodes]